jgi:hypothetical protein
MSATPYVLVLTVCTVAAQSVDCKKIYAEGTYPSEVSCVLASMQVAPITVAIMNHRSGKKFKLRKIKCTPDGVDT